MRAVAEQIATCLFVGWMIYAGFVRKPGAICSWPMFTRDCAVLVDLTLTRGQTRDVVNVYALLPSHSPSMNPHEFGVMLEYLGASGAEVNGSGMFFGNDEVFPIAIEAGHVVD